MSNDADLATDTLPHRAGLSDRLHRVLERVRARSKPHARVHDQLWDELARALEGGKRIRPDLVLRTHDELGGHHDEAALDVAAAFELLHTAFLLHDDVIDQDTTRRGAPNVIGAFAKAGRNRGGDAVAWGQAAGILGGDLLVQAANGVMARLVIDRPRHERLLDLFEETVAVTVAGELQDVGLTAGMVAPVLPDVLAMTHGKTAHYSFRAPVQAGAILAGAGEATLAALDEYGRNAGIAFQLRDDLLGVFGDPAQTGKSTSTDLRRATMTPLVAYALQTDVRDELRAVLGMDAAAADDARARDLLERCGARDAVHALIAEHVEAARRALATPDVPARLREHLMALATIAGERAR